MVSPRLGQAHLKAIVSGDDATYYGMLRLHSGLGVNFNTVSYISGGGGLVLLVSGCRRFLGIGDSRKDSQGNTELYGAIY